MSSSKARRPSSGEGESRLLIHLERSQELVTDTQVRKLREEMRRHGQLGLAALRSGMHRNTARRYIESGLLPSQRKRARDWRTREDPFGEDWEEIAERLKEAPELEAKALFEDLMRRRPGRYRVGQLRTFQRHVKQWRAESGPPREIFFPQEHRAGEAIQSDFTRAGELKVTILGEPFDHLLGHSVLPYSNWQSVRVCKSESMLALRRVVQKAVFRLGRVPRWHQTDNSTAATHDLSTGKRGFNGEYEDLMEHLGMQPRTIAIGQSHQNGDVEALGGALKRRLEQHLLLRGSRDFDAVEDYESWIDVVVDQANDLRSEQLEEELAQMQPLRRRRLPEHREQSVRVTSNGTIRVLRNTYSVPSRLKGERVWVRISEMTLEILYGGRRQLTVERLLGENGAQIDYRHVIDWLVKKPWAFVRYRHRVSMFPTQVFRRAYDALSESLEERQADLDYLRVLHLAARTMQCDVEATLAQLLAQGLLPRYEAVREELPTPELEIPTLKPLVVDLQGYDALLPAAGP